MKQTYIIVGMTLGLLLSGCSFWQGSGEKGSGKIIDQAEEITRVEVTGYYISMTKGEQPYSPSVSIQLEDQRYIDSFLKVLQDGEPYSGDLTEEGPNFTVNLFSQGEKIDSIDFWLARSETAGRFAKQNGETFLFESDYVRDINEVLEEKVEAEDYEIEKQF